MQNSRITPLIVPKHQIFLHRQHLEEMLTALKRIAARNNMHDRFSWLILYSSKKKSAATFCVVIL